MIKERILEGLVALCVLALAALGSNYYSLQKDVDSQKLEAMYVSKEMDVLKGVVQTVHSMQVEMSKRGEWMAWVTGEIIDVKQNMKEMHTNSDAAKDFKMVDQRIKYLEGNK